MSESSNTSMSDLSNTSPVQPDSPPEPSASEQVPRPTLRKVLHIPLCLQRDPRWRMLSAQKDQYQLPLSDDEFDAVTSCLDEISSSVLSTAALKREAQTVRIKLTNTLIDTGDGDDNRSDFTKIMDKLDGMSGEISEMSGEISEMSGDISKIRLSLAFVRGVQQNAGYSIISKALLPVPTPGGADIPAGATLNSLASIKSMSVAVLDACLRAYELPCSGKKEEKAIRLYAALGGHPTHLNASFA